MKNVLFIVIDSVTNDIMFNKPNSKKIAPFLNELRNKSISGDKMYSEAPYTEAALMSLLASVDTMDNGGYMERLKNSKCVLEVFKSNGYKTFFNNYYPSIYPSFMVKGYEERKYIEGFQFAHIWEYRLKYFSDIYFKDKITDDEYKMLIEMLEDNLKAWIDYLEKVKTGNEETSMLNENIDTRNIEESIKELKKEYKKFVVNKKEYLIQIFTKQEEHPLYKIPNYKMCDKIHNNEIRQKIIDENYNTFKRIDKLNRKFNLKNNRFPINKFLRTIINRDFVTSKGLLAGYKNSIIDKDLYDRINKNFDEFKVQRSFNTVSEELFKWIKDNKNSKWMSYVHVDDAHFPENFFTYDTDNINIVKEEFKKINKYLDELPKNYKGSIAYDLSLLYCDGIIKKIFNFLEKEKILDDTAIIITADHGFSYYFSPVREKYVISSYKENYNVPFIVYSKELKKKMVNNYCSTKDIPATLLDLVNIAIPKDFKGKSLIKYDGKEYATLEYMGGGCPDIKRRPIKLGVRTDNYSVVMDICLDKKFAATAVKEIYDLKKDPLENHNLVNNKKTKQKIQFELNKLEERYNELKEEYYGKES